MTDITVDVIKAKNAALILASLDSEVKNNALTAMADALNANRTEIISANTKDLESAKVEESKGEMSSALVKRLMVDDAKIDGMIEGIRDVASLPDPVGETTSTLELDNDLMLYQIKCPLGVLGVIFESRPDVVPQIMSLCLKSGNAVVFKGGREALNSNRALFDVLTKAAESAGVPKEAFVLMEKREDVGAILGMHGYIDLLIPRGSNDFVRYIQENTKIPVLGHAAGICHIYVSDDADMELAKNVVLDSKIQYSAACNAVETVLIDSKIAQTFLPEMVSTFNENKVEVRVDEQCKQYVSSLKTKDASDEDWDSEYNELIVSMKIVDNLNEAIDFINKHGSHHTDCIITSDSEKMSAFVKSVDSADVFINASTRFADGYRFGKGAEVGISTNKIHSRGPVGMEGLMIYKYVLVGKGQVVRDYVAPVSKKFTHKSKTEGLRFD